MGNILDIREEILRNVQSTHVTAAVLADDNGIIAGVKSTMREIGAIGLSASQCVDDGTRVKKGDEVVRIDGSPKQVLMAEEVLIGLLGKASGIATSAHRFVQATEGKPRVVCGAWKKMPPALKEMIREAIVVGGASFRIAPGAFVYLDKNYVELLGGIKRSLGAVAHLNNHSRVLQVKGRYADVVTEACEAAESGADIVFIDTGRPDDIGPVVEKLIQVGLRNRVKLAFGGGVNMETIDRIKDLDVDILDIGRQIVDAPILDMRLEIVDSNHS